MPPEKRVFVRFRVSFMKGQGSMHKLTQQVVKFLKAEDGPTAVEYAVMLALIIVVCLVAITALGTAANKTFDTVGQAVGSSS
jgi:pilus assembly protein Flp/PilA